MLKTIVKAAGAAVLYRSGLLDRMPRPMLTVLGYHRVLEAPLEELTTSPPGMVVTRQMFERQLGHAARRYRMVGLDEIHDACEGRQPLPPRACLVTFDDGWRDNYTVAFPILRRMGIPATIFVTTDYIGTHGAFWFTTLMQCLLKAGRPVRRGEARAAGWPPDLAAELDRIASLRPPLRPWHLDTLIELMKRYPESAVESMVGALAARLDGAAGRSTEAPLFLTWDQLREMERSGIGTGSHTCTHKILTQLANADAFEELRRSRQVLEAQLGHPIESLAFPNGDYTPFHMQMAWEIGYRLFFVSSRVLPGGPPGRVFPRPCVHDRVGRGPAMSFSPSLLEFHLAGVAKRLRG